MEELSTEAYELKLYIENDSDLYRKQTVPIYKNLQKKKGNGTYNSIGATKLFQSLVINGAKKYSKEYSSGNDWNKMFSVKDRLAVAREFEKYFSTEYRLGNRWEK
jgi:hypothetical protein